MKFTLSTKPLADALDLGVIPGNISKYYRLSCLAELTASKHELRINLEASNLMTELLLKGSGDTDDDAVALVDCLVLKQLISTLESQTVTLDFEENSLTIHSGSSKFSLPYLADTQDGSLKRPQLADSTAPKIPIDGNDWKFIKDYQMYALALSFVYPVYTNVWVGESGDVIVGDYNKGLFTFSKKNKLGKTCLLPDTIINLFNCLPQGASITLMDKSYRVDVKTDGYEYATEFCPKYEGENNNGSYSAPEILASVAKDEASSITVAVAPILKFLGQSDIVSSGQTQIEFSVVGQEIRVKGDNIDCKVKFEGTCPEFSICLDSTQFKSIMSHVDTETIKLCPAYADDEIGGLVIYTNDLTVMVSAFDEGE